MSEPSDAPDIRPAGKSADRFWFYAAVSTAYLAFLFALLLAGLCWLVAVGGVVGLALAAHEITAPPKPVKPRRRKKTDPDLAPPPPTD